MFLVGNIRQLIVTDDITTLKRASSVEEDDVEEISTLI